MSLLLVDRDKCAKDGICIRECPANVITLSKDGEGYPEMVPWGPKGCTRCGHCVAVCPHGAMSHMEIPIESCPAIEVGLLINEKQAEQFLRSRRSVRSFQDKAVEEGAIRRLIEIARYAPTGGNAQPLEWQVITDRLRLREISGAAVECIRTSIRENPEELAAAPYLTMIIEGWDKGFDTILRDTPVLIAASAPKDSRTGMVDLSLALSYLDLMAPVLGLGTCWAGLLQRALLYSPPLKKTVGIPPGHTSHYPMMLGYPKVTYHRLPERRPPKITFKTAQ